MQRSDTANPPPAHAAHVEAPSQTQSAPSLARFRTIGIGLVLALAALFASLFAYGAAHDGRVFRGVSVLEKDLSSMNKAEAQTALLQAAAGYSSGPLTLSGAGRTWTLSPADLGLALDVDKTLDAAMSVGRASGFPADSGAQLASLLVGSQIKPVFKYDTALVDKAIARIAADVDKPAVDSKLAQADNGSIAITPSAHGTVLDRDALRAELLASIQSVPAAPVAVYMKDVAPRVTEDALKSAESQALLLTEQPITLSAGKRTWTIKPAQLRDMLDVTPPAEGSSQWNVALGNNQLAFYLQPMAEAIKVEPEDATVVIGKGTVTLKEDEAGLALDAPAAIAAIQQAAQGTDEAARIVKLPTKSVPADVHTADVQALYDKANALVTEGIRLHFRDDGYIVRGTSVTGFIDVARTQGGPGYKLVVDEDVLSSRISGVAYNINRQVTDARFRMVGGVPKRVAQAKEGYKVNVPDSLQTALKAINSYNGGERLQVDLTVAVTPPNMADADISTINTPDLLGTGQTSYVGSSAERAWNVGLGTRNVDGALIPPGGTFSTVEAIGDLTLAAGFKMGYAIVNTGKGVTTVPAEAGGICQVATTLFHSVFWAGLPMVERNWHSYWIGTYGRAPSGLLGLDATIAPPEKDFRFKNTTSSWILIKASADGKNVTFQLYGVNPGWKVSVSGPVITNRVKTSQAPITEYTAQLPAGKKAFVEHAQDGFSASITRMVRDSSGNVIDNWTARSRYAPAHNRYLIGTGQ